MIGDGASFAICTFSFFGRGPRSVQPSNSVLFLQHKARFSHLSCNLLGKADERYLMRRQVSYFVNQQAHSAKPSNACIFVRFFKTPTCTSRSTSLDVRETPKFLHRYSHILLLRLSHWSCLSCRLWLPH